MTTYWWIGIVSSLLFALIPAQIARTKGRSFGKWYIYGFFLFIVALIHSIVIKKGAVDGTNADDLRKCPHCAELIKKEATICKHCHSTVEPVIDSAPEPKPKFTTPTESAIGVWQCKKCGAETIRTEWVCKSCGAAR
jgi:hypothetical protein